MLNGFHHFHLRKRGVISSKNTKSIRVIDRFIFVVGALGPIMTIPQLYEIWVHKDARGVSLISWSSYFIFSIFWIIYGIVHKEKVIVFTYSL